MTNLAKTDNFAKFANKQGAQAKRPLKTNENRPQFHFFECSHTLSRHGKHSDAVGASAFRSLKYYFPINLYVGDTQFFELVSAKLGKIPNTSNESNLRTSDFKFGHSATGRREFPSFLERNTEESLLDMNLPGSNLPSTPLIKTTRTF